MTGYAREGRWAGLHVALLWLACFASVSTGTVRTSPDSLGAMSDPERVSTSASIDLAIGSFDTAIERLPMNPVASRDAAIRAAHAFRTAALSDDLGRTQRARLLYNAGASLLLAGEHSQAIVYLRSAERLAPMWAWDLRKDILTNLTIARSAARSHLSDRQSAREISRADPERELFHHLLIVVPPVAWLVAAGALVAAGTTLGLARLAFKRGPGHVLSASVTLIGVVVAAGVFGLASDVTSQKPHAVVMIADTLPRTVPDEVLGEPLSTRCPMGTEVVVLETLGGAERGNSGPVWLGVRRLGDPAAARFWLPASAIEMIE